MADERHPQPAGAARTVIVISPHFPPSQLAGVHRARHLARHLPAHGWKPIILCVDERFHDQRLDLELARRLPVSTEIVKAAALPQWFTRWFGLGDISLRGWFGIYRRLAEIVRRQPVDAVMITGAPYYTMMLAPVIKRRFGIPVILDFQDPWVSHWGASQPLASKAGVSHWIADHLEPLAMRSADFVTTISDTQRRELAHRHPWFSTSNMAAIPIGGDLDDFASLENNPVELPFAIGHDGMFELSYIGSFWPKVEPTLRAVMRGLARLRVSDATIASRLRVNFIGTDSSLVSETFKVMPIAKAEGVDDLIREFPRRLPFYDALGAMLQSDALLLVGSDEPHYSASKIYPALMSGRNYVSLFHAEASAHELLRKAGGGINLSFSDTRELPAIEAKLADAFRTLVSGTFAIPKVDPTAYAGFEAQAIAARFAEVFDRVREPGATRDRSGRSRQQPDRLAPVVRRTDDRA